MSKGTDAFKVNRNGDVATVDISEESLSHFGSFTLLGVTADPTPPKEINLIFPETSMRWKEQHGGPNQWIVNEHVIKCLVEDILYFVQQGKTVHLGSRIEDPTDG